MASATWQPRCSGVRGKVTQGKGQLVGLFQGEFCGDVGGSDAARPDAMMVRSTKH